MQHRAWYHRYAHATFERFQRIFEGFKVLRILKKFHILHVLQLLKIYCQTVFAQCWTIEINVHFFGIVEQKEKHFKDVHRLNFGQLVENEPKILIASRDHAEPEFFYKSISHYINGFSDGQANFWIGLDTLHKVTTKHEYKLRVVAYTNNNIEFVEEYLVFNVGNKSEGWRLNVAGLVLGRKLRQSRISKIKKFAY